MTDDDTPIRLKDAIAIAFPHGGMTVSGLRRESARGNLKLEMIANKHFVTLRAIKEMRELCQVKAKAPGRNVGTRMARTEWELLGITREESFKLQRDAFRERLKKPADNRSSNFCHSARLLSKKSTPR